MEVNIPKTFNQLLNNNNYIIVIEQIPNFPFNPTQNLIKVHVQSYVGIDYSYWKNEKLINKQPGVYRNINTDRVYLISPEESILK